MKLTHLKGKNLIILGLILTIILPMTTLGSIFIINQSKQRKEGKSTILNQYEIGTGGYPRITEVGRKIAVTYFKSNLMLSTIDVENNTISDPVIIVPGGDRPQLIVDKQLSRLVCIFNKDGMGNGASIGIAYANISSYENPLNWTIQERLLGPVEQLYKQIGIWEPYLYPINHSLGEYLLFFSNQTDHNPSDPLASTNYVYQEDGHIFNQQISVYWVKWNGTVYTREYAGILSEDFNGEDIFEKDGMVSIVKTDDNAFLATFETFTNGLRIPQIKILKFEITSEGLIKTIFRKILVKNGGTAPFLAKNGEDYLCSYHSSHGVGLVTFAQDQDTISSYTYLPNFPVWWGSLYSSMDKTLWYSGGDEATGLISIIQFSHTPHFPRLLNLYVFPIVTFGIGAIGVLVLAIKKTKATKK